MADIYFQIPETVPIYAEIKRLTVLHDPSEPVLMTLIDPAGVVVLTDAVMSKESTGIYVYYWQSALPVGWYKVNVKVQDGTGGLARVSVEYGGFTLQ